MTNAELESRLFALVRSERRITVEILSLLQLAQERKIHLEQGYPSLFEWLVKKFGYSEGAAYRRVQAARLVEAVPGAIERIQKGTLSLTALAKTQSAIQTKERLTKTIINESAKAELVDKVSGQSIREVERTLSSLMPEVPQADRVTETPTGNLRLHIVVSRETVGYLKEVRKIWSHRAPFSSLGKVIEQLSHDFLQTHSNTARVSRTVRAQVLRRDQRRCQYQDPVTGRFCHSRYQIEIDHIQPKALGGQDTLENLRCLCRAHNQYRAEKTFGRPYRKRERTDNEAETPASS